MKERPILFSAPMVRALLDGSKTQTRRVAKVESTMGRDSMLAPHKGRKYAATYLLPENALDAAACCPYGQPGDRLWVRETFADLHGTGIEHRPISPGPLQRYAFAADIKPRSHGDQARKEFGVKWKPSIFMPRAASRITLEITGVRVERLQDISETDAKAEGIEPQADGISWKRGPISGDHPNTAKRTAFPKLAYQSLWESINGPDSWGLDPWVWVIEFRRVIL